MLKIIDALVEKHVERNNNGKATKIEKAIYDKQMKFWSKHPKLLKFLNEHEKGVDIACDVVMTAALLNLGYQLGKGFSIKAINSPITSSQSILKLADDGKALIFSTSCTHSGGIHIDTSSTIREKDALMKLVDSAVNALKNQGVEIHTI